MGHGIGNITRAFDKLIEKRPQLAIQARKRYKITQAGIQRVRSMMAGNLEA